MSIFLHLNIYCATIFFCISPVLGYSQKVDTIFLNRVAQEKLSFNKSNDKQLRSTLIGRHIPPLKAGDYTDGNTKFTVAIGIVQNKEGENQEDCYNFLLAPYKEDTIYTNIGIHEIVLKTETPIIAKVGDREYRIKIAKYGKFILITKINGNHLAPDVKLFNNYLPDMSFSLLNGGKSSFLAYMHKNKYIYIEFWGTWCSGCLANFDALKEANKEYTNRLIIISLDYMDADMKHVKDIINENHLDWIQGISDEMINKEFLQNGFPYGILFDSKGNIIERDLPPANLHLVLNNLLKSNRR